MARFDTAFDATGIDPKLGDLWHIYRPGVKYVSFDNPDFVDVVIQSYRHRYGYAPGDPALLGGRFARRGALVAERVEDDAGRRYWLFREGLYGREDVSSRPTADWRCTGERAARRPGRARPRCCAG